MFQTKIPMLFPFARNLLAATVLILLSAPAFGATESDPVTADNWQNHPRTVAVRDIYKSVEENISSKRVKAERREFEYCEAYVDTLRIVHIEADGRIRKYHYEGGSDDSAMTVRHYYDERGTLRFVFASGGAVNDTHVEYRVYFDEAGKRFWHDYRLVAGPGYTFPSVWPEEFLIRDPKAAFAAETGCAEIK